MKPVIASIAILAVVAIFCAVNAAVISDITHREAELLNSASDLAGKEQWTGALAKCKKAESLWESRWTYLGSVLRHTESDEVSTGFGSLIALASYEDVEDFASRIEEMNSRLRHIREMELPSWANIL